MYLTITTLVLLAATIKPSGFRFLFWEFFSAVWTEFHSRRDCSTAACANSSYWRSSRTLLFFSNNEVYDQPDDASDDNNNKP